MGGRGIIMHFRQTKELQRQTKTMDGKKGNKAMGQSTNFYKQLIKCMLGLSQLNLQAFPYFQNPICGKHIGKLEIQRSKYNKRQFPVSPWETAHVQKVFDFWSISHQKQTMRFSRDTTHKWLMALNVGEQNEGNRKTIGENKSDLQALI